MSEASTLPATQVREPVTLMFHWVPGSAPVTLRFDARTGAGQKQTEQAKDVYVAGLYALEGEPFSHSGEADVYHCRHRHTGAACILKWYRHQLKPKAEVVAHLHGLAHPHLITMLDHGIWQGRFYEVSQLCQGGVATDILPMSEAQCRQYLPDIVSALQFLHGEGIIHRDIKPGNLFFTDVARQHIVVGDFGISSYMELGNDKRMTQTAAQMTLDYAAPELLNRHEVSPATDYYALGVTLLHLHLGHSPFQGKHYNDILVAHLRARIPVPEHFSDEFRTLIAGLTHFQPEHRWQAREITRWLRGEHVEVAPLVHVSADEGKPYPALPDVTRPAQLAANLHRIDALTQLMRGDIQRWVFDYFDARQAERIARLEDEAIRHPSQALAHLPYVLDPEAPLRVGEQEVDSLRELAGLLHPASPELMDAWNNKSVIYWLQEGQHAAARTHELVERLEQLYDEMRGRGELALFCLRYILNPAQPLDLGLCQLHQPTALKSLFARHGRKLILALAELIADERFERWLELTGQAAKHYQFVRKIRLQFADDPALGAYCVLWHFAPDVPLPFAGRGYTDPAALAAMFYRDDQYWQRGVEYLQRGWLTAWLLGCGSINDMDALNALMLDSGKSPPAQLDILSRLMNPDVPRPRMVVQPEFIKFGKLQKGEYKTRLLRIRQAGCGCLHGRLRLSGDDQGLVFSAFDFEGALSDIEVTLETLDLKAGEYEALIAIEANAGVQCVPVYYTVEEPERGWWPLLH